MNHSSEIDWLLEMRPEPPAPTPATTDRARAALLAHAVRRRRERRRARALALAVPVLVAGAAVALEVERSGHAATGHPPARLAVTRPGGAPLADAPPARGTPLAQLAADVRRLPRHRQRGDATLVVRYTVLDGRHSIDGVVYGGYDLYTDRGRDLWAPDSLAQLQRLERRHGSVPGSGDEARVLRRIAAAANRSPARARLAVLGRPDAPVSAAERRTAPGPPTIIDVRAREDSLVWLDATQALAAGAGRPAVRAACIEALGTLHGVRETRTRVGGTRALRVSYRDGPARLTIWLDARTGVPIQERDGTDSTTTYAVERVTAAHLPDRVSNRARLR